MSAKKVAMVPVFFVIGGAVFASAGCGAPSAEAVNGDGGGGAPTLEAGAAPIGPTTGADGSTPLDARPSGSDDGAPTGDGASGCNYDAGAPPSSVTDAGSGGTPADSFISVSPAGASVELYHPLTVGVTTTSAFKNGFDPDDIALDLDVTGPCGEAIVQPCFFRSSTNGQASWECRFAPRHAGAYSYRLALREAAGLELSTPQALTATATTSDGFLHPDTAHAESPNVSSNYDFRFDSGKAWRGVGENVAWEIDPYKFPVAIARLQADGLNMMRIWHAPWSLPMEWNGPPTQYNADSADYFDEIVDLAEKSGVYLMVMMDDYREFHEQWANDPYNQAMGGWCGAGGEFFSNGDARAAYKKKLRYYVARWGHSPAIQSFEFFNELDNAMNEDSSIQASDVTSWVAEMSSYLHAIDPSNHMVTASVSYVNLDFWKASGIDFTQSHLYGPNNRITNLPSQLKGYVGKFQKPYSCGEFSRRWEAANTEPPDNYRQELHYGMWLGMVQPTPILPMTWWWDSHWNWGDDFVFRSIAGFSNDLVAKAGSGGVGALTTSASGGLESGGLVTGKYGYAWVSNYNPGQGTATGVALTISGLRAGDYAYTVERYDTWNGGFAAPASATSANGVLTIDVGTLGTTGAGSDAAYRIVDVTGP
jgi:hypothetical protein